MLKLSTNQLAVKSNFSFLNFHHIQNNLNEVINYVNTSQVESSLSFDERKEKYIEALNTLQNSKLPINNKKTLIEFDNDNHTKSMIRNQLLEENDVNNKQHLFSDEDRNVFSEKINKAFDLIKLLHEDLYNLINQQISTIYVVKKDGYGGGSVSGLLGFIWLNPQPKWSILDYAENLYHEFIHNSLFLDDMVNSIFPDPLACAEEDGLVISTILNIKRPLDKSYHAANVAIGVMHFYNLIGNIPEHKNYFYSLNNTLEEINKRTYLLGDQGKLILEVMNNFNKEKDFDSITKNLRR